MVAMRASGQRLCQMVHDASLRHGTEDHLQTVLATGWFMAIVDACYVSNVSIIYEVFMLLYYHSWMFDNHFMVTLYHFLGLTY